MEGEMAFGMSKPTTRSRELPDLPDDWVAWLEPGVELEGDMKVSGGLIRLNAHLKGDIVSDGAVVVHDQGEVDGNIQSRVVSITGKVKGTVHAKERLEIKEHGSVVGDIYTSCLVVDPEAFFDGQCHMATPEPARQTPKGVDSQEYI
jgi:cytoskeletal protein CcmA (bactofilin family)